MMTTEEKFAELLHTIETLNGPNGCQWDKKQTHNSLRKYLIEECYETIEAIDEHDPNTLKEELGDVLYQILFHSEIAKKNKEFSINDVIETLNEKMIRRHPHVFAGIKIKHEQEILDRWEKIKLTEKGKEKRHSITDGIPLALPALQKAQKLQKKIAKVGFDWDSVDGVIAKIEEELLEVKEAISKQDDTKIAEEIGDLIFSVVNLSRYIGQEAEYLLHDAIKKFTNRFKEVEKALTKQEKTLKESTLAEMEELWNQAKEQEKQHKGKH